MSQLDINNMTFESLLNIEDNTTYESEYPELNLLEAINECADIECEILRLENAETMLEGAKLVKKAQLESGEITQEDYNKYLLTYEDGEKEVKKNIFKRILDFIIKVLKKIWAIITWPFRKIKEMISANRLERDFNKKFEEDFSETKEKIDSAKKEIHEDDNSLNEWLKLGEEIGKLYADQLISEIDKKIAENRLNKIQEKDFDISNFNKNDAIDAEFIKQESANYNNLFKIKSTKSISFKYRKKSYEGCLISIQTYISSLVNIFKQIEKLNLNNSNKERIDECIKLRDALCDTGSNALQNFLNASKISDMYHEEYNIDINASKEEYLEAVKLFLSNNPPRELKDMYTYLLSKENDIHNLEKTINQFIVNIENCNKIVHDGYLSGTVFYELLLLSIQNAQMFCKRLTSCVAKDIHILAYLSRFK